MNDIELLEQEIDQSAHFRNDEVISRLLEKLSKYHGNNDIYDVRGLLTSYVRLKLIRHKLVKGFRNGFGYTTEYDFENKMEVLNAQIKEARRYYYDAKQGK